MKPSSVDHRPGHAHPVGTRVQSPAGWYPVPGGMGVKRYWDGAHWASRCHRIRPCPERASSATGEAPPATTAIGVGRAVLTTQDGATYPLDRAYVIGRAPPQGAARCRNATPIVVHNDPFVSRVHAYVWVHRGVVFICDASTAGGTFISPPGAESWTRVRATPVELPPDHSLLVGSRILTYRITARH